MAKRKTKKEKIVDLVPKPEKVTDTQLNRLQATVRTLDHFTLEVGKAEINKAALLNAIKDSQVDIEALRNEFKKQYNTDNINIHDGTIGYPPERPNSKENGKTDKKD